MKKVIIALGILLAGAGIYIGANYSKWLSEYDYGMAGRPKRQLITTQTVVIQFPVWFYNPMPFAVIMSNLDLDVIIDGTNVGKIKSQSYKLLPKQKTIITLEVTVSGIDLLRQIVQSTSAFSDPDWRNKTDIQFKGTVGMYAGPFYIQKLPIDFKEKASYYLS